MFKRSALVVLVVLSSLVFVASAPAQTTVWQIDSEHSTARLFLASSRNPDDAVNVGVARANGVVTRNADDSTMPDFDFTIYPADKTASRDPLQQEQNNEEQGHDPDYTVINFKSTHVIRVDTKAFRVTGDLTLTYVERVITLDPSEADSGPVYGPAITHSVRQEAVFEFRQVDPSGAQAAKKGNAEWFGVSTISGENFPELLDVVSATNWPIFVADEHFKDLHCAVPTTIGEDYAGEVCTHTSSPVLITDTAEIEPEGHHHGSGEPHLLVANAVKIELDLDLTNAEVAPERTSGE